MKQLKSQYFSINELLQSQTATRKNIEEQFTPSDAVVDNLQKLVSNVLDTIRFNLGVPVRITSGYRCKRLNKAIGGVNNSQHTEGKAVDIQVPGMTTQALFDAILEMDLPFDQIIQEFDQWIHVSYDDKKNRREVLKAIKKNGRTQYIKL